MAICKGGGDTCLTLLPAFTAAPSGVATAGVGEDKEASLIFFVFLAGDGEDLRAVVARSILPVTPDVATSAAALPAIPSGPGEDISFVVDFLEDTGDDWSVVVAVVVAVVARSVLPVATAATAVAFASTTVFNTVSFSPFPRSSCCFCFISSSFVGINEGKGDCPASLPRRDVPLTGVDCNSTTGFEAEGDDFVLGVARDLPALVGVDEEGEAEAWMGCCCC